MVSYLTILFLGKPHGGSLPYLMPILLPVTDNLLFLNQRRRECFSTKECAGHKDQFMGRSLTKQTH